MVLALLIDLDDRNSFLTLFALTLPFLPPPDLFFCNTTYLLFALNPPMAPLSMNDDDGELLHLILGRISLSLKFFLFILKQLQTYKKSQI
jgi:hypothetical protein